MAERVKIIGAGLAGSEAAYFLARHGVQVELYESKPKKFTPAHTQEGFAELVCSNSLKSEDVYGNACGLLKEEMRILGSLTMEAAKASRVPAGGALAVERDKFSDYITRKIEAQPNIAIVREEVHSIPEGYAIVATGPLTLDDLAEDIQRKAGGNLYFYDAAAPIVSGGSIDFTKAFCADRYGKGEGQGDYVNCPMTKEEYEAFVEALNGAERAIAHAFDKREIFEGCMPIEVMAARGKDTLRYGMMKPVGLYDSQGKRPYAVLQLRKENSAGTAYNLVGCQTNLKFGEQKRVFSMIPALREAEFLRYGVMHRNTFLNAPQVLNADLSWKKDGRIFFAGQMTGVEGYVESAASGIYAAIGCLMKMRGTSIEWDATTVMGALARHVVTPTDDFQPMNANYGIVQPLGEQIRDKAKKKQKIAERALQGMRAKADQIESALRREVRASAEE